MNETRKISLQDAFKLARAHNRAGRPAQAERIYREILRLQPNNAAAHNNLGKALQIQGKPDDAITCYRRAIAINPDHVKAHGNLGHVLQDVGRLDEAVASFQRTIDIDPEQPEPYNILGNILTKLGKKQQAVRCYQRALSINPEYVGAQSNLGVAYKDLGELDEAIASYQRALAIDPNFVEAYYNLGNALRDQGKWDEAIAFYRRALEISPSHPNAHWNYARILLLRGQFEQGWREHEWRWKCEDLLLLKRNFAQPLWDGSTLNGVTILLHCEQGLGDSIQFIRYAPMVARLGGRVVVGCPQKLRRLFQSVSGIDRLIDRVEEAPAFDVHAPLLSLPHIFKTDLETIPNTVPYLSPPSEPLINLERGDGVRVGIVWAGKSAYKYDTNRSVDLGHFTSIANMEGCVFYSLQVGERRQDIRQHNLEESLIDLGEDLTDFAVTASAIERLDLVISVDTAVAHLAGALGKPVWTLLPYMPDWRWMLDREDTPWYPTMRLFRQKKPGDWEGVFRDVEIGLRERVRG